MIQQYVYYLKTHNMILMYPAIEHDKVKCQDGE